jgi:hypothetical protein
MSAARIGRPHSEQTSSTWLIWPQAWCRYSAGGPAAPASHLSPQATITMNTSNSSSPLAVSAYSWRGGRLEYSRRSSTPLLVSQRSRSASTLREMPRLCCNWSNRVMPM